MVPPANGMADSDIAYQTAIPPRVSRTFALTIFSDAEFNLNPLSVDHYAPRFATGLFILAGVARGHFVNALR